MRSISSPERLKSSNFIFPGSITIIKDASPEDGTNFGYTTTGGLTPATFTLDDDADPALSNTQVYSDITNFTTYTITEGTLPAGWTLEDIVCGVLDANGYVDNDATLERYRDMGVAQAEAGSQLLGLSGMMDGQVAAVRDALDDSGYGNTPILAYAAKYASAFYGPFREAVQSSLEGDRRTYQQDPANRREGARELDLDIAEGADIVMVKPAMSYLDVLADAAATSPVPVWAYQVSGEYSMIEAAAAHGWIDRRRAIEESVIGIRRAGADAVLTYWALELAEWIR